MLKLRSFDFLDQVLFEGDGKRFTDHSYITESHCEVDVLIILNEIDDGAEQRVQCIFRHIRSHARAIGDWDRVGINCAESLLVNGVLADGRRNLFLSGVPYQVILNNGVHDEDGLQVMNILPLRSLREDVHLWTNLSICNLWQLRLHIESEAAEILDINAAACLKMLLNVLNE